MIQTVIFDIDDTLYSYTKTDALAKEKLYSYCVEQNLMPREEAVTLHGKMYHDQAVRLGPVAASHNRLIRYQFMMEEKGLPIFPHAMNMAELYWKTLIGASEPEPGIIELFKTLHEKEIKVGIGTNMTSMIQFKKLEHLGLTPYIDFVVTSEEAGSEKPEVAFFETCAKKAGCKMEECIFIGDSINHDMNGAKAAGMHPILYWPEWKKGTPQTEEFPIIHNYKDMVFGDELKLFSLIK